MGIRLATKCEECFHEKVCKNRNNAKYDMDKLSKMTYGCGPNDDYYWPIMMEHRHVDITFSCPDFNRKGGNFR